MRISIIVLTIALALSACTRIPNAELSQYRTAFDKASTVKDEVLINFDTAVAEATSFVTDNSEQANSTSPFPSSLNASQTGPDATAVRQSAWRVIERYNATLSDLAEGKSDESVKSAIGGFGQSIGKLMQAATGTTIPGFGAIIELAQTIGGRVEEARRANEFRRAIREGGPLVHRILDALYEDANDQYTIKQALSLNIFVIQTDALTTSIGDLYALAGSYQPSSDGPVDDAYISTINDRLNAATLPLANQLVDYPYSLSSGGSSGSPFTIATRNTLELRLAEIEQKSAAMVALIQEVGGMGEVLREYQTLLTKTKVALTKLDRALDAPINIESEADEIIDTIFKIKQGIEKYRSAREKANTNTPPTVASSAKDT